MRKLPAFDDMAKIYPGDSTKSDMVRKQIGGAVDNASFKNTCIIRVSVPLNKLGHPIPKYSPLFGTRQGKDKMWYGLRVTQFWDYMTRTYGPPDVHKRAPLNRSDFRVGRGIIGFRVNFKDATGHFTLWDSKDLLFGGNETDYFARATEGALWLSDNVMVTVPEV
jgi:hypothetical protein